MMGIVVQRCLEGRRLPSLVKIVLGGSSVQKHLDDRQNLGPFNLVWSPLAGRALQCFREGAFPVLCGDARN